MTTKILNRRLDRLHGAVDLHKGIAARLDQAKAIRAAQLAEYRQQGLTEAEISTKENNELRERLAALRVAWRNRD